MQNLSYFDTLIGPLRFNVHRQWWFWFSWRWIKIEDRSGFMWGRRDGGMPDFPVVNLGHMHPKPFYPPYPHPHLVWPSRQHPHIWENSAHVYTDARRCMHGCVNMQTDIHTCRKLEGWLDTVRAQTPWLNRFCKLNTLRQTHMYKRHTHTDSPPPDNPVAHTKPLQPSLITESCDGRDLDMTLVCFFFFFSLLGWTEMRAVVLQLFKAKKCLIFYVLQI